MEHMGSRMEINNMIKKEEFKKNYEKYFEMSKDLYLYTKERDYKNFKKVCSEIKQFDDETCKTFGVNTKLDQDIQQIRLRNAIERQLGSDVVDWIDDKVEDLIEWLECEGWDNDKQILLMDYYRRFEKGL